jgi:hypothetical protein
MSGVLTARIGSGRGVATAGAAMGSPWLAPEMRLTIERT